ncbi:MAG: DUF427 domain-containing protein [Caldilineaceae bacterium]|nr:DUF427 domain-containing protein [Caldilineaceae bacterium]
MRPTPIKPGPGQESVWAYPRPPRLEKSDKRVQVIFNGVTIADTHNAYRVLETSHPPVYYIPPDDIAMDYLIGTARTTFCEWKGAGAYYTVRVGDQEAANAAWYYPSPTADFTPIRNYVAFYPGMMDACYVDGEQVQPQPGGFYGGWVTQDVVGPFKGEPSTMMW